MLASTYHRYVRFAGLPPSKWLVTLADETEIEVWADGYTEEAEWFVFSVLVDASETEQRDLDVVARTPSRKERVMITVARVPTAAVRKVLSA